MAHKSDRRSRKRRKGNPGSSLREQAYFFLFMKSYLLSTQGFFTQNTHYGVNTVVTVTPDNEREW